MQDQFITQLLGIKGRFIELVDGEWRAEGIFIELHTRVHRVRCPECQEKTSLTHGYRRQVIRGRMIEEKPVYLRVRKRRYRCGSCTHTFYEQLPFVDRYQRRTHSLNEQVLTYLADQSFSQAGKIVGMTSSAVLRLFDRRTLPVRRQLPETIAIDEFKGDAGGERFQTIIVDAAKHQVIEILPNRRLETIVTYLRRCDTSRVRLVVMDLSKTFKESIRAVLDQPIIVADRFHFMRQAYWALDKVRKEVQQALNTSERIKMKRSRKLLWMAPEKLQDWSQEKVTYLLGLSPKLRKAYLIKNALHKWLKTSNQETAARGLDRWMRTAAEANLPEFNAVIQTFKNWRREILNAFVFPYSNGFIEGINNTTKVLKRQSYGIKSFDRLRKKILFRQAIKALDS
jgi:transposase